MMMEEIGNKNDNNNNNNYARIEVRNRRQSLDKKLSLQYLKKNTKFDF